jgi:hypothetical protein
MYIYGKKHLEDIWLPFSISKYAKQAVPRKKIQFGALNSGPLAVGKQDMCVLL